MNFELILFTLIFIYLPLWIPIKLFLSSLGQKKFPITIIENKPLQQLIFNKTGVRIKSIKIAESKRLFGAMIGIPTSPQLVLSRHLYQTFSPSEMEYVVLHEAGHYKLNHGLIEFIVWIFLFIIGLFILNNFTFPVSIITSIVLSVFLGIIMIRLGRLHEYQADYFTVKRMTNPKGMIEATNKFKNFPGNNSGANRNKILQFLFFRRNPYNNRIRIAKEEIEKRK